MEDTINLKDVLSVLKRRFILIMTIVILAAVTSGLITYYLITPTYQAKTLLLVNQSTDDALIDVNQVRTNIELTNTYSAIIKSPTILSKVVSELNLNQSAAELDEQVTVTNNPDSQVVEILVEDKNSSEAVNIANGIATMFQKEIITIMKVDNVNILSEAVENPTSAPVRSDLIVNVLVALVLGACCGIGLSFLLEYLDTSIKSEKDIEDALGIPVIGNISIIKLKHKNSKNMIQNHAEIGGQSLES